MLKHHLEAATASLSSLVRKPLLTFSTVLVIAMTLMLPSLFWVITDNVSRVTLHWQEGGRVSLYLKSTLSKEDEAKLLKRVQNTVGVGSVDLITPKHGLQTLQQQEGMQDIMRYLPENPLPTVIEVVPSLEVRAPEKLEQLYLLLKSYAGIDQAKLDMQWVNRWHALLNFASDFTRGLMVLLGLAVLLIIGNTILLAFQHQHEEIQISKLIGAKDAYILRPFLYLGLWYGFMGALVALGLVYLFLYFLTFAVADLATVYDMHFSFVNLSVRQILLILFSALFLGWLGAFIAVKRGLSADFSKKL